jgi:Arylsulfotransferase (ASST)
LISIFDNGAAPQVHSQSRGIVLALDHKRMRATLHRQYTHRPPAVAHALGNTQVLENGNVLVGWGTQPYFTEYRADGTVALDLALPRGGQNYRALRLPWSAGRASRRGSSLARTPCTRAGTAPRRSRPGGSTGADAPAR